jgi:hypothetical protein
MANKTLHYIKQLGPTEVIGAVLLAFVALLTYFGR